MQVSLDWIGLDWIELEVTCQSSIERLYPYMRDLFFNTNIILIGLTILEYEYFK